jgi:hypothetical protein
MNFVIGSAWRDGTGGQIERYLTQVAAFQKWVGEEHNVRVLAVEGDSRDHTQSQLLRFATKNNLTLQLVTCDHGHPPFGSTESPIRMAALSQVGNAIFANVRDEDDVLVYVESDLIWEAQTIAALINSVIIKDGGFDVFAPLVMAGANFYDIWAFRKNGSRFGPYPPFHPDLRPGINEVDSAGSCLVMDAQTARVVPRMTTGALVEWCNKARAVGVKIGVRTDFAVAHP